jgi:hypothetical protein
VPWRQLAIGIVNGSDRLTAPPRPSPTVLLPLWKLEVSMIYELSETGVDVRFTVFMICLSYPHILPRPASEWRTGRTGEAASSQW